MAGLEMTTRRRGLRVSEPELLPLSGPVRVLLDSWMSGSGWTWRDGLRGTYGKAAAAVVVFAVDGCQLEGIGAYLPGKDGTPIVIVRQDRRRNGIGSLILEKLMPGMPVAIACSDSGAALCRAHGLVVRRVHS